MRGPRLDEDAFEKGDHAADDKGALTRAKGKLTRACALVALWFSIAAGAVADETWRVWMEPKSMRPPVANPIAGSERTLLAAGTLQEGTLEALPAAKFEALKVTWGEFEAQALRNAAADLAGLTPQFTRNRKNVIEYATLESTQPIVASAVLAPGLLQRFAETLGESLLLVVPNRYTAFLFPALGGRHEEFALMVHEAYRATPYPVSLEVFEVTAKGMRAIGVYEEP